MEMPSGLRRGVLKMFFGQTLDFLMPGAGCAGSPEPCGAQSVLVAPGGAVVPRPHRSVPGLCRDHRGPGEEP